MMRLNRYIRRNGGASLVLIMGLLVAALALLTAEPSAQAQPAAPTAQPTPETTRSVATSAIPDRSSAMSYTLAQPFPSTAPLSPTIEQLAVDLRRLPQPLTPPADALRAAELLGAIPGPLSALSAQAVHQIYLPASIKSTSSTPPTGQGADVALTLVATPSIRVARDGTLVYQLRLNNYGQSAASGVQITLPYNRQQVTLTNASFVTGSGDWVSAIGDATITVNFGPIAAGAQRSAYLYQRVAGALPNDAVISVRATYRWSDNRVGGSGASNWAPVLVGGGNDTSAYLWLTVSPASGKAGTLHRFYTDRFIPGEGVVTWLNTPSGVKPLDLRGTADGYGRIWLDLSSAGLTPGNYSLVAYGGRSGLTAVSGFTVQP